MHDATWPESDVDKAMPCQKEALPARLPHVACVLLWYPLFTQPFIFREVECLAKVMPVQVYTLYGPNMKHCSQEMRHSHVSIRTHGLKAAVPALWELLRAFLRQPRQMARLFRRSVCRRWTSLEVFGENFWAFLMGVSLGRAFREDGIDIAYAPWPRGAATAAWVGATLAGIPFALAARGDNLAPADPDLDDKLAAAIFVRANNMADKKRIEAFGSGSARGKTVLAYNSLTLPQRAACPTAGRFAGSPLKLLALGRFDVTKGFDVLLDACAILKKKGINFQLTLAGAGGRALGLGGLENALRKQRHDLDLEREVSMPGLVSHDELPAIMASHDIFAAPCVIHASGRWDGIPNTVIEALACGIPVVSTNINALPEVVINGKTGLAVSQGDAQALADAIYQLAQNPAEALRMAANGMTLARNLFDPAANADRLAEVFIKADAAFRAARVKDKTCAA